MTAYIVAGYRTAVGKAPRGGFRFTRTDDLAAEVIKHLMASVPALDPTRVDDVIVGNAVPEAEQGLQIGRMISLLALPINVPGLVVNRYCGSGIETIAMAASKITAGMADCIVAGGAENMSQVPTVGWKTVPNYNLVKNHPDYYLGMGLTAEAVAKDYNISREDQDRFAYNSHQKAIKAIQGANSKSKSCLSQLRKLTSIKRRERKKPVPTWLIPTKVRVPIHLLKLWPVCALCLRRTGA